MRSRVYSWPYNGGVVVLGGDGGSRCCDWSLVPPAGVGLAPGNCVVVVLHPAGQQSALLHALLYRGHVGGGGVVSTDL